MRGLIDSLTVTSGAIVTAVASAVAALLFLRIRQFHFGVLAALTFPFVFAGMLYWSPVLLGGSEAEYGAWALLFLVPWTVAGTASAAVVFVSGAVRRAQRRKHQIVTPPN